MRFENFAKLTNSKLVNKPWVDSYTNIELDVAKIKRGDLFICEDTSQIEQAISNGAYAIATEVDTKIIDDEIAWIKAESLESVLNKLLRFSLLEKKIKFFYATEVQIALLKQITSKKEKIFLSGSQNKNFKKIINSEQNDIFVSSDKEFLTTIYPDFQTINADHVDIQIVKKSLFLTSFIYNKHYFANIKIPELFLHDMQVALDFLNSYHVVHDIYKCNFIDHFKPVFIDQRVRISKFGSTSSVLIFEKNYDLIEKELNYLIKNASWAKIIIFLPYKLKDKIHTCIEKIYYKDDKEILELKTDEFNFALAFSKNNKLFDLIGEQKSANLLN